MNTFHLSGYPRIGAKRELKFAVEAFWKGAKSEAELQAVAAEIRRLNWAAQKAAGADFAAGGRFFVLRPSARHASGAGLHSQALRF